MVWDIQEYPVITYAHFEMRIHPPLENYAAYSYTVFHTNSQKELTDCWVRIAAIFANFVACDLREGEAHG
jgi:hypothetical protein